jgi:hypothetical protein
MLWPTAASLLAALLGAAPARAFPTQNDRTPGTMALGFRKQSNVWSRVDVGAVDAKVTSTPPDSTKLDRGAELLIDTGFDIAFAKRWGFRMDAVLEMSKRRQSEQDGPKADVDETTSTYTPSADVTFVTDKGLEIFGGVMVQQSPAYDETVTSDDAESKTKFAAQSVQARRFGVVRRAGPWSGGFYYVQGGQKSRRFEKTASDGSSIDGDDVVFIPSRVAVFGEIGSGTVYDLELAFVQARGLGPKDELGNSVYTDYFEAKGGAFVPFGAGLALEGGLFHRTLQYARSAFVSLDTIPVTSVRAALALGERQRHFYAGLVFGYGKDGQSQPEFNADYEMRAMAITLGLLSPF